MKTKNNIIGIGTDIISIDRFAKSIERQGETFINTIFTEEEKAYCKKFKDPTGAYAVRFSAKEAVAKALGCGFNEVLTFLDIEIIKDDLGKPSIRLSSRANEHFEDPHIELSLSHCKEYATAFVIAFSS
ncbi:MAG: Holo-[acyl-carrier-protein] synthase [Chlamydiia bacterium]|nr:Holo-[acyl-carrier-protein] synthase [Chlamydiia bacterium]